MIEYISDHTCIQWGFNIDPSPIPQNPSSTPPRPLFHPPTPSPHPAHSTLFSYTQTISCSVLLPTPTLLPLVIPSPIRSSTFIPSLPFPMISYHSKPPSSHRIFQIIFTWKNEQRKSFIKTVSVSSSYHLYITQCLFQLLQGFSSFPCV